MMHPLRSFHRGYLVALTCLLTLAAVLPAAEPRPLSEQRWSEEAYGLSLRPPVGTHLLAQTADDALLRVIDEEKTFQIDLSIKQSRSPLTLDEVVEAAFKQIRAAQPMSVIIGREEKPIAGKPAAVVYFEVPTPAAKHVLLGQAAIQLDPQTFAVLELRTPIEMEEQLRPTFEAVLDSIQFADQEALAAERQAALERGEAWRQGLSVEQIRQALVPKRTYRLLNGEDDIGYMSVEQRTETIEGKPGIRVDVQTRIHLGPAVVDSEANYFLSDDDATEFWSIRTATRQAGNRTGPLPAESVFTETGARVGADITVSLDGPDGRKNLSYQRPAIGYLSQVEAWLFPQLVPHDKPAAYGFYWYHSGRSKMTFRHEKVTPALNGYVLSSQLSHNEPPITATYGKNRQLVEKQLPENRRFVPADPALIQRIWRNR